MSALHLQLHELGALIGQELAVTDWLTITQERIDRFAAATDDRQWIHTDPERARRESPYGTTVAHGFLTLALVSYLLGQAIQINGMRMGINYGLDRVRFPAPVPVGARVRSHFTLESLSPIDGGVQMRWHVMVEVEGAAKPGCVAVWLTRRYG